MATLEGRLFPEEEIVVRPLVKRLPAEWRVQVVRAGAVAAFDVRVVIPNVGEHSKTFAADVSADDILRFLEWVRDNPKPEKLTKEGS